MIKKFNVKVNGKTYEVEVEEVSGSAAPKFGRALPLKNNAPKDDSKNTEEQ